MTVVGLMAFTTVGFLAPSSWPPSSWPSTLLQRRSRVAMQQSAGSNTKITIRRPGDRASADDGTSEAEAEAARAQAEAARARERQSAGDACSQPNKFLTIQPTFAVNDYRAARSITDEMAGLMREEAGCMYATSRTAALLTPLPSLLTAPC